MLSGDPNPCAITWKVTDTGSGIRLRRQAVSGANFHIVDVTVPYSEKEYANLVAQTMAVAEGGTAVLLP